MYFIPFNMASETNACSLSFNEILDCIQPKSNLIYKLIEMNNGYIKISTKNEILSHFNDFYKIISDKNNKEVSNENSSVILKPYPTTNSSNIDCNECTHLVDITINSTVGCSQNSIINPHSQLIDQNNNQNIDQNNQLILFHNLNYYQLKKNLI